LSWTFNPALVTARDRVRLHIGDTKSGDPQLADETLDALLVRYVNEYRAAEMACKDLAAKYAREVDRDVQDTTLHEGDRIKHYTRLAYQYRFRR
jgi:hypothetical protein